MIFASPKQRVRSRRWSNNSYDSYLIGLIASFRYPKTQNCLQSQIRMVPMMIIHHLSLKYLDFERPICNHSFTQLRHNINNSISSITRINIVVKLFPLIQPYFNQTSIILVNDLRCPAWESIRSWFTKHMTLHESIKSKEKKIKKRF
jgi:hypothetical protein